MPSSQPRYAFEQLSILSMHIPRASKAALCPLSLTCEQKRSLNIPAPLPTTKIYWMRIRKIGFFAGRKRPPMRGFGKESISAQNRGSPSPAPRTVGGSRTAAPDARRAQLCRANISRHPHQSAADWLSRAGLRPTLQRSFPPNSNSSSRAGGVPHWERSLGRKENRIAAAGNRLAENFFGRHLKIKVGDGEPIDPGVEADVHQAPRYSSIAPASQKSAIAKSSAAEAQNRNL